MTRLLSGLLAATCMLMLTGCTTIGSEQEKERVVIQVSDDSPRTWNQALNVAGNLRKAYGKSAEIEVVPFGLGTGMIKADAIVANRVRDGKANDGVHVYACENSMTRFKLKRDDMLSGLTYVPSGVEHIIKRQKEGWAVIRP